MEAGIDANDDIYDESDYEFRRYLFGPDESDWTTTPPSVWLAVGRSVLVRSKARWMPCTVTKLHGEAILADDLRTTSVDLRRTADGRSVSGVPLADLRAPGACLVPLWQLETVRWFILGTCDQQSPLHRLRGQSWLLAAVVELLELHQVLADNLIGVLFSLTVLL